MKSESSRDRGTTTYREDELWVTVYSDGVEILQASALGKLPWLVHGFSTRLGGTSLLGGEHVLNLGFTKWDTRQNVRANRAKLLAALHAEQMTLTSLRQFHSDIVCLFDAQPHHAPAGDAAITRLPGVLLTVQIADCVPILLVDTENRAVAVVHAGWRGTLRRVAAKTLGRMQAEFGTRPQNLKAALGPAVGRCCYEVGPEVAQAYASQFGRASEWFDGPFEQLARGEGSAPLKWLSMAPPGHDPPPARVRLDLVAANRWQLLEACVKPGNIVASSLCTACRTDLLFSYRKEGAGTGRLMGCVGLRGG